MTPSSILKNHLPDIYDEWLKLHTKDVSEHRKAGQIVETVKINPDEFAEYLDTTKAAANLKSLENFTVEIAAWKKER
jgi:hypothetical protein